MNQKLKIGIIGIGNIASIHAKAIQASSNLELVAAFSRNDENVRAFGIKYKISAYSNWEDFISNPNLEAVSICTPNGTHLDYGSKSAKAKKHIIVEKPIEVTIKRAKKLMEVCKSNEVSLAVIYQNRFLNGMIELKEMIKTNGLGKIFMANASVNWYRSQAYYDSAEWRGSLALDGGGVLINQAIHTIDLLQWLVGDIKTIFGQTDTFNHQLEGEDNAVATLRFKNGAIGTIQASTSIQPAQPRKIEIYGEKGTVIIDGDVIAISMTDALLQSTNRDKKKKNTGSSSSLGGFSIETHKKQFETIATAIDKDNQPTVSGEESLKSLAIVLAIYQSAKNNTLVELSSFK